MSAEIRTVVSFTSSRFNTLESKEYFINKGCFGDDVAKWLIEQLRRTGYETTDSPGQEDFGWYFNFKVSGTDHCFVVGYRPGDSKEKGVWIGWLERSRSWLPSILGGRKRGISPQAVNAIHTVLKQDPPIQDVHWHFKRGFDSNREDLGASAPW